MIDKYVGKTNKLKRKEEEKREGRGLTILQVKVAAKLDLEVLAQHRDVQQLEVGLLCLFQYCLAHVLRLATLSEKKKGAASERVMHGCAMARLVGCRSYNLTGR